jgi:heme exporter protein D
VTDPAVTGLAGLAQALSAGRYGVFVWPAYGVTALGFVWMIIDTLARARRWRREANRLERADEP